MLWFRATVLARLSCWLMLENNPDSINRKMLQTHFLDVKMRGLPRENWRGLVRGQANHSGWFVGSVGRSELLTELKPSKLCRSPKRCTVAWYKCRPVASSNHCQPQEEPIITSQDSPLPARYKLNGSIVQYFVIYEAIYA